MSEPPAHDLARLGGGGGRAGATVAERPLLQGPGGLDVSREHFAAAVAWARARIDARTAPDAPLILSCKARDAFLVALCAGLSAGRRLLLPHDETRHGQAQVRASAPGAVVVADDAPAEPGTLLIKADWSVTEPPPADLGPDKTSTAVLVLYTSGSRGVPTAHEKSWADFGLGAAQWRRALEIDDVHGAGLVATVPSQHMYGLESTAALPLWQPGLSLWAGRPFYPADVREALAAMAGPRILLTTPVHLNVLRRAGGDLPPLHRIVSATAPLDEALASEAERLWGAPVLDLYGSTETGMIATRRPARETVWRPRPDLDIREATPEEAPDRHAACDAEADGLRAVVVSGPHLPAPVVLSDRVIRVPGGLVLEGRGDDLVNVAGKRASLAGLNSVLCSMPGVEDGVFLLPPEPASGVVARPVALVVGEGADPATVISGLRQRLAECFVPRRVVRVPPLPRDRTGKLRQATLMALFNQHVREDEA